MAVLEEYRSKGAGSKLLDALDDKVRAKGVNLLWCNGRVVAGDFYRRHGWVAQGEVFEIMGIPHLLFVKILGQRPPDHGLERLPGAAESLANRMERPDDGSRCSECGAAIGGEAECQTAFGRLRVEGPGRLIAYPVSRLVVDCYCLQHPAKYCKSAKSLAAHLVGLLVGLEFGGKAPVHEAVRRWLDSPSSLTKPEIPGFRGAVTILDIQGSTDEQAFVDHAHLWARTAWDSYGLLQSIARSWLNSALGP